MTSDSTSIRNPLSKLWLSRQATSMSTDGSQSHGRFANSVRLSSRKRQSLQTLLAATDGSQSAEKPIDSLKPLSRSPTELNLAGSEPKDDHTPGNGQTPSPPAKSSTINVVLFGETGVGKSSVINLIARKDIAKVSSDVNGCTMQYQRYDIPFEGMNFSIFDTIGLEEPQMGVNGYLKAIEKAYELISKLSAAGGIHLLLFCMRGGRITATTQSNYRLFCECLCNTKVPIALVFTGLEREEEMENWWRRNKTHIEHYGIKSDGHACITAVQDDTPGGEDLKYVESQKTIRELLKNSARKGEAFSLESQRWFARLGRQMKSFVSGKRSPKKRDVMKVLTNRCKLDLETAKKIADMMEKGEEGEGENENGLQKNPVNDDFEVVSDVAGNGEKDVKNKYAAEVALPEEPDRVKAAPHVGSEKGNPGGDSSRVAEQRRKTQEAVSGTRTNGEDITGRKNVAEDTPHQQPNSVEAAPNAGSEKGNPRGDSSRVVEQRRKTQETASGTRTNGEDITRKKNVAEDTLRQQPNSVEAAPNAGSEKGNPRGDSSRVVEQRRKTQETVSGIGSNGEDITGRKNVAEDTPRQQPNSVEAAPRVEKEVNNIGKPGEKGNTGPRVAVKPPKSERRNTHLAQGDPTPVVTSVGRPQP